MGTIWVKEFTGGLDTRRLPETTPGGVLLAAVNGHISRGGEFEKRAAFVKTYTLPPGTVGLGHLANGLMVFGHTTKPATLPAGLHYRQLVHPGNPAIALSNINSYSLFKGKDYVSATFADGDVYHYYGGVNVEDWDYGCAKVSFKVTGGKNIKAAPSSTIFRITGGTNAVSNRVTAVYINGVRITQKEIQHDGNNTTTAAKVAAEINRWVSAPNYIASAKGDAVTVTAVTAGIGVNGKLCQVTKVGNVTTNAPTSMAGGVNAVASTIDLSVAGFDLMAPATWVTSNSVTAKAVVAAINGYRAVRDYHAVWDGADGVAVMANLPGVWANNTVLTPVYTNGFTTNLTAANNKFLGGIDPPTNPAAPTNLPYLPGDYVTTHGSKEYSLSGSTMYFSAINAPTKWKDPETNIGAGFIDMAAQSSDSEELMAIAKYQNYLAIFAYSTIQVWYTDPDPDLNKLSQVLNNTGTRSPRSVCQFGDNDVYYLDESGIRSLKARDSSNSASTADVGVLIDTLVIAKLQTMTYGERLKCFGLIEPTDGRFWLTMGDVIFVFSYFAGAKVSAWSTYIPSTPGTEVPPTGDSPPDIPFRIDEALVFRRRVYVRSGDEIYCYSGEDAKPQYDTIEAYMQTPYLDASIPAKEKSFHGWDAALRGVWQVSASFDPTHLEAVELLGVVGETTFPHNRMSFNAQSTHVSLRFATRSAEAAKVGSGLIHFNAEGEDDGSR